MSGQQSENELKGKKTKCVTRKFQVVQHNGKEIYKKKCAARENWLCPN